MSGEENDSPGGGGLPSWCGPCTHANRARRPRVSRQWHIGERCLHATARRDRRAARGKRAYYEGLYMSGFGQVRVRPGGHTGGCGPTDHAGGCNPLV